MLEMENAFKLEVPLDVEIGVGENLPFSGKTSSANNAIIKNITGKVIVLKEDFIFIQFNCNSDKVYEAVAICSLSDIFLDGVRYGVTTESKIISYLFDKRLFHGMAKKLDVPLNRDGYEVKYKITYKKVTRFLFLHAQARKPRKSRKTATAHSFMLQ